MRCCPTLGKAQPADMYPADAWWIAVEVFDACSASEEAQAALQHGARWIRETCANHVPAEFRDSFLGRNPVNRALLAAAGRRLAASR